MDKIKALLEQLGGSKELVDKIVESLEQFKTKTQTEVKEEYAKRLEKAKEACLAEVRDYKKELAKKVQIFFESRAEKIEQQIAKQVAIKDSAAEAKLHSIAAMLEGVEVNGNSNDADLKAAQAQVKQLQEQVKKLDGNQKVLTEKANRAHAIAEKTLERNKVLAKELEEAVKKADAKTIAEGKEKPSAGKPEEKPITEDRKPAAPATTRTTSDSQIAKPQKPAPASAQAPAPAAMGGYTPEGIAAMIDE